MTNTLTPDDLIQLMRLSGTDKVRKEVREIYEKDREFFDKLAGLFGRCKRSDISEAWKD